MTGVRRTWGDAVELEVRVAEGGGQHVAGEGGGTSLTALAYRSLVGEPSVDERVLLNTNAADRGLGTGCGALVVALPDRLPQDAAAGPGHLVKARYTPLQTMVLGVDEQESPHHGVLEEADDLAGMPVVTADLHSSLPAVVAAIRAVRPEARVAYVMTDGGALAAAFSRTVVALREAGWLVGAVTTGQSFGGDLEAVTVHSGLLAARLVLEADVAVLSQGPGNLGTGTRWGYSGVAAGEALNAAWVLGGRGVAGLRMSGADPRPRHRGVSHHSRTAYGRVLRCPADLPVPDLGNLRDVDGVLLRDVVEPQLSELLTAAGHLRRVDVATEGLVEALATSPVPLLTMGRGLRDDAVAFLAAAAAGRHAASLLIGSPR